MKPLSIFGIAHRTQRVQLSQALLGSFPRITTEGGKAKSPQAGLVAFAREHLIDIVSIDEQTLDDGGSADGVGSQEDISMTENLPLHRGATEDVTS